MAESISDVLMLRDRKTEMYVKFAKVIVIRQGPFSFKAFDDVVKKFKTSSQLLSDDSFKTQVKIALKAENVEDYYEYFKSESCRALEEGNNLLVINPSMSNLQQNLFYVALAHKMQYVILVVPPVVNCPKSFHDEKGTMAFSFFKETGQVIQSPNMFQHLFCGWFLHDIDSYELRHEAFLYAQDLMEEFPEFHKIFKECGNSEDMSPSDNLKKYYNLSDKQQDIAYCCMKVFTDLMRSPSEYFNKLSVQKNYGKMSKLFVVGFIISPHMIAARVKLTAAQRDLWDMVDELEEPETVDYTRFPPCPTKLKEDLKSTLPDVMINRISSKSNPTKETGDNCHDPIDILPPHFKGKACHIVLGRKSGAKPHQVDYGVQFALRRERNFSKLEDETLDIRDLEHCVVKKMRKYYFIYLKEVVIINGFFASYTKPYPFENTIK